jgi:3D (Asp-Asp-Asp) domain-containing protein
VVITAYNPVVTQTDSTPTITASNKRVRPGIVALSRDLEEEFGFKFGDTVVIEDHGFFVFEDRMNKRWTRRVDILMISREAARKFGNQRSFLVVNY